MTRFVVENYIMACTHVPWLKKYHRPLEDITSIIIHRVGPEIPEGSDNLMRSASDIAKWYHDNPSYTGGRMPYHFVITPAGEIQQGAPLYIKAPGAKAYNAAGIQIACIGDFRKRAAPARQAVALTEMCSELIVAFGGLEIVGHTENLAVNSSANKAKICPGKHLNLDGLRSIVKENLVTERRAHLEHRGIC